MKKKAIPVSLVLLGLLCLVGCNYGNIESEPTLTPVQTPGSTVTPEPTITSKPTNTPRPTRLLTQEQRFELEEKQREEERIALLVSPTPGPEPYVLLGQKTK